MLRIAVIASIVSSEEVEVSKKIASMVLSPELKASYSLEGSISMGTETSAKSSYQRTVST